EFSSGAQILSPSERASSSPCSGLSSTTHAPRPLPLPSSCLAWRGPCAQGGEGEQNEQQGKPHRLPVRPSLIGHDEQRRTGEDGARGNLGLPRIGRRRGVGEGEDEKRNRRPRKRSHREILVAWIEYKPERDMDGSDHSGNEQCSEDPPHAVRPSPARRIED